MDGERSIKRPRVDLEQVDANEAIQFELESGGKCLPFKPEMCHQLFGDEETIVGHENPSARISIDHRSFKYRVIFTSDARSQGATEVEDILTSHFKEALQEPPEGPAQPSESLPAMRDLARAISSTGSGSQSEVHVFYSNLRMADKRVKAIHSHAQQLMQFFIDGATPIEQSEPEWDLLIAVRELEDKTTVLVGFCTVYRIYAYPNSSRLRVSQLLVLPPFQKQGIGRGLLEAVYKVADEQDIADVIYEEPTEEVQALRDKIELDRSRLVPWLKDLAIMRGEGSIAMNGHAGDQLPASLALDNEKLSLAQKQLRIPRQQVRRLWEALLMQQKPFQNEPGQFPLRGLVARRLIGKFSDTEQQAVGKQVFTAPDGHNFCMRRVPKSEGLRGAPVALEDKKEEGQSKEEREEALDKAVEERMQFLCCLVGLAV